uniref:Uncharacterized protein n=1 Tax=Timema cristinae TaxID=61476 RepID=A0A7R9H004_TIMCR|nr:unnamed protein product [Timema cristinae]
MKDILVNILRSRFPEDFEKSMTKLVFGAMARLFGPHSPDSYLGLSEEEMKALPTYFYELTTTDDVAYKMLIGTIMFDEPTLQKLFPTIADVPMERILMGGDHEEEFLAVVDNITAWVYEFMQSLVDDEQAEKMIVELSMKLKVKQLNNFGPFVNVLTNLYEYQRDWPIIAMTDDEARTMFKMIFELLERLMDRLGPTCCSYPAQYLDGAQCREEVF